MRYCFLFRSLELGGTETLMARMSKWLVEREHSVTVISPIDGPMRSTFAKAVRVVVDPRYRRVLFGGRSAALDLLRETLRGLHVDVFFAFSTDALWVGAALANSQEQPSKILAGVYVQGGYVIGPRVIGTPWLAAWTYPSQVLFQRHLPPNCRLFMNAAVKEFLDLRSTTTIPGVIWPLPVDGARFRRPQRSATPGKIVSVGRLDRMKEYNLWMIDVVDRLRQRNPSVHWEVFGDGPLRRPMLEKIKRLRLEAHIELKGSIAYADLGRAFERAHVFVGMGTTLIEAASAGIPAVVARAFDRTGLTYGFLHDLPEYSCGEAVNMPARPIEEFLLRVLDATSSEYVALSNASQQHAARFDENVLMERFLHVVHEAPRIRSLWRPSYLYWAGATYEIVVRWFRNHWASQDRFTSKSLSA